MYLKVNEGLEKLREVFNDSEIVDKISKKTGLQKTTVKKYLKQGVPKATREELEQAIEEVLNENQEKIHLKETTEKLRKLELQNHDFKEQIENLEEELNFNLLKQLDAFPPIIWSAAIERKKKAAFVKEEVAKRAQDEVRLMEYWRTNETKGPKEMTDEDRKKCKKALSILEFQQSMGTAANEGPLEKNGN